MNEDLKWLAENVHEWEDGCCAIQKGDHGSYWFLRGSLGEYTGVGEICFTRTQWQAARDEMGLNHSVEPTEKVWQGPEDGLPPVGTECICQFYQSGTKTIKAIIRAYFEDRVWVDVDATCLDGNVLTNVDHGQGKILVIKETEFKPLPTEEEDRAVEKAMQILKRENWSMENDEISEICRTLYRAGLRFTEQETK